MLSASISVITMTTIIINSSQHFLIHSLFQPIEQVGQLVSSLLLSTDELLIILVMTKSY